ncbi:hypothetical protein PV05_07351 [Exophiala xenobiotica]|uniref:F-box domain-containing protein n=1 Tax=Exophiala xenobiotica TaxID=348802 RepID=A0A0D2EK92_9EURO|nr:uncharacterized protein PV05_07351 [Exophiala xenobiotica]KIW55035.1 hypothetical protein PV05_07351 [Exophiala xenobiotica]
MTDTKGWAALPFELQLIIASLLDRNDLKCLRSIHSRRGLAATAILFSTVHISPNTRSFARALQVAQEPHLASYVRRLVYHIGIIEAVYGTDTYYGEEDNFYEQVYQYECYLEEIDAQEAFLELDEIEELSRLTSRLNNLESIATIRDEYDPFLPPHGYIEQRTGLPAIGFFEGRPFASLFEATAGSSINKLQGEALSWGVFADVNALPDTSLRLGRLKELSLGLYITELSNCNDPRDTLQAMGHFLGHCTNLEALSLDFDEFPFDILSKYYECVSRASLYKCRFPRLTRLSLRGLITYEDKFIYFLEAHSSTPVDLTLADLMVVGTSNEKDSVSSTLSASIVGEKYSSSTGSVVSVFQRIHDVCNLKRVRLRGNFTNRFDESWYVYESISEGFVPQIRRFLCRQGPSPFPALGEYCQMQEDTMKDWDPPPYDPEDLGPNGFGPHPAAEQFCDDSWEWCPELLSR